MTAVAESTTTPTTTPAKARNTGLGGKVFSPNADVPRNVLLMILGGYAALLVIGWLFMPAIIPSPARVWEALTNLITTQGLLGELWVSLELSAEAILLSTIISLAISYAAAIPAFRPLAVAIGKGRFLSLIGLSFIMTLYVGGGHPLKLSMLTFGMTVFFVTSMVDVVLQVPVDKLDYVRTLRAGEWRVLLETQVYGTLGLAFDTIRQNAAMGWLMLTMVEGLVRGEGGIGRMLIDQEKHFTLAGIFAVQSVFLLVGIGQDALIAYLKSIVAPFSMLAYQKGR